MGLDMYLERMPKFKRISIDTIMDIQGYFSWKEAKEEGNLFANCTLKDWCGADIDNVAKEVLEYYEQFYTTKYYYWDGEHKYPRKMIYESIGYWRKANAIHNWFVINVQDGEDDCAYYEVSRGQLEKLLDICNIIMSNPDVASEYLPTQSGFFFGSTEYDEWYMQDIKTTIEILTNVLETTDFNNQIVTYRASW